MSQEHTNLAISRLLENRVEQARLRLAHIPLDSGGIAALVELCRNSYRTGDNATLVAAMRVLAQEDVGREALGQLRRELFAVPAHNPINLQELNVMTNSGKDAFIWNLAIGPFRELLDERAPDLSQLPLDAHLNLTAHRLVRWDVSMVTRHLELIRSVISTANTTESEAQAEPWHQLRDCLIEELEEAHHLALTSDDARGRYKTDSRDQITAFLENLGTA